MTDRGRRPARTIYLDAGSIHAEMLRRHPEILSALVWLNTSNSPEWAFLLDKTDCVDGPADINWDAVRVEDYYGFRVQILPLRNVDADIGRCSPDTPAPGARL